MCAQSLYLSHKRFLHDKKKAIVLKIQIQICMLVSDAVKLTKKHRVPCIKKEMFVEVYLHVGASKCNS